ncbi:hypothetical protein, partial [Mesorhizobium sp. M0520]|uniref:hypothetical protein n=1 Tax=Mesorhizobium sp. M0520 TaxID=2956957 RepID=UPI003338EB40
KETAGQTRRLPIHAPSATPADCSFEGAGGSRTQIAPVRDATVPFAAMEVNFPVAAFGHLI